jgi:hypothetical protein
VPVKTHSTGRVVRAINAIAIDKTRAGFGKITMLDLVGLLLQLNSTYFAAPMLIKETQFDFFRVFGKYRKIDALTVPGSAQRVRASPPDN